MPGSDPTLEVVLVPVPVQHLGAIYGLLGRLMSGHDGEQSADGPPPRVIEYPGLHGAGVMRAPDDPHTFWIDEENGAWKADDLLELLTATDDTPIAALLDAVAQASPGWLRFADAVDELRIEPERLRGQLGAMTKACRRVTGRKTWPMSTRFIGNEMSYRMPDDVAKFWLQGRDALDDLLGRPARARR